MTVKVAALIGLGLCALSVGVYAASTSGAPSVQTGACPICRLLGL